MKNGAHNTDEETEAQRDERICPNGFSPPIQTQDSKFSVCLLGCLSSQPLQMEDLEDKGLVQGHAVMSNARMTKVISTVWTLQSGFTLAVISIYCGLPGVVLPCGICHCEAGLLALFSRYED